MSQLAIKSSAICCPEPKILHLFDVISHEIDQNLIPPVMRRRTAITTRMAITAAHHACQQAVVNPQQLPSIFVSLGGEIQVTDVLCQLIPDQHQLLSPTHFHNSVHNTTAAYWGILNHCQQPSTSISAVDDGFAMGIFEAYSQLHHYGGDILLVCYDEYWPQYLAAPLGKQACACAFILTLATDNTYPSMILPEMTPSTPSFNPHWCQLVQSAPATAAILLLQALKQQQEGIISLNIYPTLWQTYLSV